MRSRRVIFSSTPYAHRAQGGLDHSRVLARALRVLFFLTALLVLGGAPLARAAGLATVQSGTATSNGNGTVTVSIASVDPTKSFLLFSIRSNSNRPGGGMVRGRIASATTLEFVRVTSETSVITIEWSVVSYASGVRVQRGETTQSAVSVNITLPTPVTAVDQAFVTWSKTPSSGQADIDRDSPILAELTSTSNLQIRTKLANTAHIIWWQVVEFLSTADINVQKGTLTSMTGSVTSVTATLNPPMDPAKTFVLIGYKEEASGKDLASRLLRAQLTNSTTLTIDRVTSNKIALSEITWQAVELTDGSVVQRGSEPFASGTGQKTVSVTAVDPARAVPFASNQVFGGQSMGRTAYTTDDFLGVASAAMKFASPTQLQMTRNNTAAASDFGWFVVEFGPPHTADLALTKTANTTTPTVGDTVTYTVTLSNGGNYTGTGIVVTDLLPAGLTYLSHTASLGTYTSGTGAWAVATLAVSGNATLTLKATVAAGTGGSTLTNTASVTQVTPPDPVPGNNTASAAVVVQKADVALAKVVNTTTPTEGDTVAFTVTATNLGPHATTVLKITDLLPAGFTYLSHSATQGTYTSGTGLWNLGALVVSASRTLTVNARVNASTAGSTLTNTATITSARPVDLVTGNNTASAAVVVQKADLALAKSVNTTTPTEGDTVTFTVTVTNNGPHAATVARITDLLPTGFTYLSHTATQGTYTSGTGLWNVGALAVSASHTLTLKARVNAGTGGSTLTNTASITTARPVDTVPGNNSASAAVIVQKADLALAKSANKSLFVEGDTVTYTVTLNNLGPHGGSGIKVTDTLPAGLSYVSHVASLGTYVGASGLWTVGSVANGAGATLTLKARVNAGTAGSLLTNTVAITTARPVDPVAGNNTASVAVTVEGANLAVTKSVSPAAASEGDTLTYTVGLSNGGPHGATGVEVTDVLPPGLTYLSYTATQGTYASVSGLWTVGGVANGASATLTLRARINAGTAASTLINSAAVTRATQKDPSAANNSVSASLTVRSADLRISKTVTDPLPGEGDVISYRVVLSNFGPDTAPNIRISDLLPGGLTYISHTVDRGTYQNPTGVWNVGTLARATTDSVRIMPLGDSITSGSDGHASYRYRLWKDLLAQGYAANFVGTLYGVPGGLPPHSDFDQDHEGHTGWRADEVAPQIASWTAATQPDIVLLHLGTNDMAQNQSVASTLTDLGNVIDGLRAGNPNITILFAQIITTPFNAGFSNIPALNSAIPALAASKTLPNSPVIVVDQATGWVPATDSYDGVHPNDAGEIKMAGRWLTALTPVLNARGPCCTPKLTVKATVNAGMAGATLINTAAVTLSGEVDPLPANNSGAASLTVSNADLALTHTANTTTPTFGDTVSYTVTLRNQGPQVTTGVAVTHVRPAGLTFLSATPSQGTFNSSSGIWTVGTLANQAQPTLVVRGKVNTGTGGSTLVASASVTASGEGDSNPANNSGGVSATVQSADLALVKTTNKAAPTEGDTLTFTVTVTNNGPHTATSVKITDLLPAGLTYLFYSATQGTYTSGTGLWDVGTLTASTSRVLTLVARVNAGTGGSVLINTAAVTNARPGDPNSANNTSSASATVQKADLALTKTVSTAIPTEGDTVAFTVTVTNNGPYAATVAKITDLLPAGFTYLSHSATQGTYTSGTGLWNVGSLSVGVSRVLTLNARVNAGTGGSTLTNTASITTARPIDHVPGNNTANASVTVQKADLALAKTANTTTPTEGDTVVFTVTVTNGGPHTATVVRVTDLLPAGFTYLSHSATQGTYTSGTGLWNVGALAVSVPHTLTVNARVNPGTGGSTLTNTAAITTARPVDPVAGNNTAAAAVIVQKADLALAKTANTSTPTEGDTVAFTVTVTNGGPHAATVVTIADLLPAGFTYLSHSATQGTYANGTGLWNVGALAVSASRTLTLNARMNAGTGGSTRTNTATLSSARPVDPVAGNNTASASVTVQSADLALLKTVNTTTPTEGDTVAFAVTVTNNGPHVAPSVSITDVLPAGLTYLSHSVTQGTYTIGSGLWNVGALAVSTPRTLTVNARVNAGTAGSTLTNTATITTTRPVDPAPGNNTASASVTVQKADLALAKSVNTTTPTEGDTVAFTVTVTNNGPHAATVVRITDLLPAGFTYLSHGATQGTYSSDTGRWNVGGVASGLAQSLTLNARVNAGTGGSTLTNTATLTTTRPLDPVPANNSASASVLVQVADLALLKSVNDAAPTIGETVTYTIVLTNQGPHAATGVRVADPLPAGLTFVSHTAGQGTYDQGTGLWSVGTLGPGQSRTLTLDALVAAGATGTLINTASVVASRVFDPDPADNAASASLVVQVANLALTKAVNDATPAPGDTVRFVVAVANAGPHAATVSVTDLLPAGLAYLGHTATRGSYSSLSGVWSVGSMAVGAPETLRVDARVTAPGGSVVVNHATAQASDAADPAPGNNAASASVDVQAADLTLTKFVDAIRPDVGDTVLYKVAVRNRGPNAATLVEITDHLPPGLLLISFSTTRGTYEPGPGQWAVGPMSYPQSDTLYVWAKVESGTAAATIINTASITRSEPPDLEPADNSASVAFGVNGADLAVTKVVGDPGPSPGDTVAYTVVLTNLGPLAATGVVVTDLLPSGLAFVSVTATHGAYNNLNGLWTVGALAAAKTETLVVRARIEAGTAGLAIVNAASAAAAGPYDPGSGNSTATAPLTVASADLDLSKTVTDTTPGEGDTLRYTITLKNQGPDPAQGVVVTDLLPAGLAFISAAASQGTYNNISGVWTVGGLAVGATDSLALNVHVTAPRGQHIVNTAAVTASAPGDLLTGNDADAVAVDVQSADLALTKTVDSITPSVGDTLSFRLVVVNLGPDRATGVRVLDPLPPGLVYLAQTATHGTYDAFIGVWTVGSVDNAGTDTLRLEVRVASESAGTFLTNMARATADQDDPAPGNNASAATLLSRGADLAVTKIVSRPQVAEGDTVRFTVQIHNRGPDAAAGIMVTDLLPAGLGFLSFTVSRGAFHAPSGVWTVGAMDSAATGTLTVDAVVQPGTAGRLLVNTASAGGGYPRDPEPQNDSGHASVAVAGADLALTKTVSNPLPAEGDTLQYTLSLTNQGPDAAGGVEVSDVLPAGLSLLSTSASRGTYSALTGRWIVGALDSAEAAGLSLVVRVNAGTRDSTIVNRARVESSNPTDPEPGNDAASATLTVHARLADLALLLSVDDTTPLEGDTVVYRIVLTNGGPDPATTAVVTDLLPAGLLYAGYTATHGTYVSGTGKWTLSAMDTVGADTLRIAARVGPGTGGTTLVDQAALTLVVPQDPQVANNTGSVSVDVRTLVGVPDGDSGLPTALSALYPNPLRSGTSIRFTLGEAAARVRLDLFDVSGRRIRALLDGPLPSGLHDLDWNAQDEEGRPVAPGVYFLLFTVDGARRGERKLVVLR